MLISIFKIILIFFVGFNFQHTRADFDQIIQNKEIHFAIAPDELPHSNDLKNWNLPQLENFSIIRGMIWSVAASTGVGLTAFLSGTCHDFTSPCEGKPSGPTFDLSEGGGDAGALALCIGGGFTGIVMTEVAIRAIRFCQDYYYYLRRLALTEIMIDHAEKTCLNRGYSKGISPFFKDHLNLISKIPIWEMTQDQKFMTPIYEYTPFELIHSNPFYLDGIQENFQILNLSLRYYRFSVLYCEK